jgi:CrcB protein
MIVALAVVAGGIGALARSELTDWCVQRMGRSWPWGTFAVNVVGSFMLGVVVGELAHDARAVLGTGFTGGFTVYATLAFETVTLYERGGRGAAATYAVASVVTGTLAAIAGIAMTGAW